MNLPGKTISLATVIIITLLCVLFISRMHYSDSDIDTPFLPSAVEYINTMRGDESYFEVDPDTGINLRRGDNGLELDRDHYDGNRLKFGRLSYVFNEDYYTDVQKYDRNNFSSLWRLEDARRVVQGSKYIELLTDGPNPAVILTRPFSLKGNGYLSVELKYRLHKPNGGKGHVLWEFYDTKNGFTPQNDIPFFLNDSDEFETYNITIPEPVTNASQEVKLVLGSHGESGARISIEYIEISYYEDKLLSDNAFIDSLNKTAKHIGGEFVAVMPGSKASFDCEQMENGALKMVYSLIPGVTGEGNFSLGINQDEIISLGLDDAGVIIRDLDDTVSENQVEVSVGKGILLLHSLKVFNKPQKQPNIVLIVLDTLRADHMGCYGYYKNTSPNLDRFSGENVLYHNAYSQAPYTTPSHASLFTSLYQNQHNGGEFLMEDYQTLAETLNELGYYTVAVTGGPFLSVESGLLQGFDYIKEFRKEWLGFRRYEIATNVDRAISVIGQGQGSPYFLFLHTYQIHSPYFHPAEYDRFYEGDYQGNVTGNFYKDILAFSDHESDTWYSQRYQSIPKKDRERLISLYDQGILYSDDILQGFLNYLKARPDYDNTMIVITADHGEEFFDHGGWEHGHSLYNELIKVPLMIKYPGDIVVEDTDVARSVELIDIYPTILDVLDAGTRQNIEGVSLLREKDKPVGATSMLLDHAGDIFKISGVEKEGGYKYIHTVDSTVKENPYNIYGKPKFYEELYDLQNDPGENRNIHDQADFDMDIFTDWEKSVRLLPEKRIMKTDEPGELDAQTREQLKTLGYLH